MSQDGQVAGFIQKLYLIMQQPSLSDIICWSDNSILIKDKPRFIDEVLPRYFRHQRMESFVRQLNLYGFKKVHREDREAIYFRHQNFRRGEKQYFVVYFRQLLGLIKLKNKMGKGSKESDEQSIVEATRNSQDVLEMNKHQFKQTLAQVNSRLRRIVKDNPMLEVELKGTMSLLRMCSVRDELGFVPAGHRLIELRDTQNLINFDSRLSF